MFSSKMKIYIFNLSAISENFEGEIGGFSQKMGETQNMFGKKRVGLIDFYWIPVRWGIAEEGKKHKWWTFLNQGMDERVEFLGSIIFIFYVSVTGWRHLCALWDSGCKHLNLGGDIKVVCLVTSKNIEIIDLSIYIYTKHVMWIHSLIFCGLFISWKTCKVLENLLLRYYLQFFTFS